MSDSKDSKSEAVQSTGVPGNRSSLSEDGSAHDLEVDALVESALNEHEPQWPKADHTGNPESIGDEREDDRTSVTETPWVSDESPFEEGNPSSASTLQPAAQLPGHRPPPKPQLPSRRGPPAPPALPSRASGPSRASLQADTPPTVNHSGLPESVPVAPRASSVLPVAPVRPPSLPGSPVAPGVRGRASPDPHGRREAPLSDPNGESSAHWRADEEERPTDAFRLASPSTLVGLTSLSAEEALALRDADDPEVPARESGEVPLERFGSPFARVQSEVSPVSDGLAWDDDRPAAAHLSALNMRDDWLARAQWMESEAEVVADSGARARMLVVVSELWAMAGEMERAWEAAQKAGQAAPAQSLVSRQMRWVAATRRDYSTAAEALESEARASVTPEARVHAAWLGSEVGRLLLGDEATAQKRCEQAARAVPSDPRAPLMKFAQALQSEPKLKPLRLLDAPGLDALCQATAELLAMRGSIPPDDSTYSPAVAFQQARRALARRDVRKAADALGALRSVHGLERAAPWLAASLLANSSETRARALSLTSLLFSSERTPTALRALVARAVEQGELDHVRTALEDPAGSVAFSAADRVALAVLMGHEPEAVRFWLGSLGTEEPLRPLAAAVLSSILPPTAALEIEVGDQPARSEVALGRALGSADTEALAAALAAFSVCFPESLLVDHVSLELALAQRDAKAAGAALAQLGVPGHELKESERDHYLLAGLVYEMGGHPQQAAAEYAQAARDDSGDEAATRALMTHVEPGRIESLLVALSERATDPVERSLLLVEAALTRGPGEGDVYAEYLEHSRAAAPELPFAYRLGEQLARERGAVSELMGWLRARREAATDPLERGLDLVREALLSADTDIGQARALLDEATVVRPGDVALHELYERLAPGAGTDKGAWREAAAAIAKSSKLPLLLTATVEYERAGDLEAAARTALAAAELDGSELGAVMAERLGAHGPGAAHLSERLFARARSEEDPVVQRELYERLSRIDRARGDHSSALLWQTAILEQNPGYLPALRRLEHFYIGGAREEEYEPIAEELANLLDPGEAVAHAVLAARLRVRARGWAAARDLVSLAGRQPPRSLWTLRQLASYARFFGQDEELLAVYQDLATRQTHPLDVATLSLRAAEAAVRLGRVDQAKDLIERALDTVPNHLIALTTQAEVCEATADFEGAAEALEASALVSSVESHKLHAWHQAGVLWLDKVGDGQRGLIALERAGDIDLTHEDVFQRLQALYIAEQDRPRLADLLQRRLEQATDATERVGLEVARGRTLGELGDRQAARAALSAALEAEPNHAEALQTLAELCVSEEDWEGAEQAWLRLVQQVPTPEEQADVYQKLGDVYAGKLDHLERAEVAYLEVLKCRPEDANTSERLVDVYCWQRKLEQALSLQDQLLERAALPDEKRQRTLQLALVYERAADDYPRAEETLERARKAWPQDGSVLRAIVEYYRRRDDARSAQAVLDRVAADTRRALNTGRFDLTLFELLSTVAELRGEADAARVARATARALGGQDSPVDGAWAQAARSDLDDLTAPDLVSPQLRRLLWEMGPVLDAASAMDLRSLRVGPFPPEAEAFGLQVAELADAFGLGQVEAFISPVLPAMCLPVSCSPPRLVFGSKLIESADEPASLFLVVRSLKLVASRAAALSRAAPIELWPMVAGLLAVLVPSWQAQSVDPKRLSDAKQRLMGVMPGAPEPGLVALAAEVAGLIGSRGSQLGTAVNQWANRVALLTVGDPTVALVALAVAAGGPAGLAPPGPDRVKWVQRHPEARDLAVFSVSENYLEARRRAGLGVE
ncbi:tetratricopeptide repeat protein [Myxococcota bacterium]